MKVIDESLLDEFRNTGRCEWCKKAVRRCEPHHVMCKGIGGGSRVDLRINLIALCHECHRRFHDGNLPRDLLIEVIADREGWLFEELKEKLLEIRYKI